MNVIDYLAKIRGGGAWLKGSNDSLFDNNIKINENRIKPEISNGYLMSSYDVYVKNEPCLMCAMALVHSRVRRVFFNKLSCQGALHSLTKLQTVEELNHSFEVFKMVKLNEV